jgi:hypothetical protein
MKVKNLFEEILDDFGSNQELVSVNYGVEFVNHKEFTNLVKNYYEEHKTGVLERRLSQEDHFHDFLRQQMFAELQEMKYYGSVNITDTRRLVAVSRNCITTIHMLVRESLYLNVYFRSSDFDGALPVDMLFISSLPSDLIDHLSKNVCTKGYEEVNDALLTKLSTSSIKLNLYFGSLHRTA